MKSLLSIIIALVTVVAAQAGSTKYADISHDSLKQAIADGRFKVNPEVVADRLLATVQELIRAYRA